MSITEFTLQSAKELMILFFLLGFIEASLRIVSETVQMAPDETIIYEEIEDSEFEKKKESSFETIQ